MATISSRTKEKPRRARGVRTREGILRAAVDLASVEGLGGLTIGRLADELKMSKSGLFAHFGSKEELQLASIEMARQMFTEHVIIPSLSSPEGMPRLWELCNRWLSHIEDRVFRGGCFFTAASFEFDSRPGPVRDRIAQVMETWLKMLSGAARRAQKAGHMQRSIDPDQFALEIDSLAIGAYWARELFGPKKTMGNTRSSIQRHLMSAATPACPKLRPIR
ncbi:MAG TPA: TetR/AcrR family transcriptional regulator [Verrucomicrobiae bacterium]|nr:TetR/AcrR family transcriptional regulator [Verrucomicrobiae bacterium]